ncbi:MAG: hypothetical protein GY810_15930, partial [Aureispira sp.]|nr:hypothetical protein [Aureispira sp.]
QVEISSTKSNTTWSYPISDETRASGMIPVGEDKLFVHLKNPRKHEYYFKVLDKKTGKEVWAIDNIKEKLIVNKEHFQWQYYPRDSFLYFRDWLAPYKEDKFALTKINLYTGEIVWKNDPMPLNASAYYYDMEDLDFHVVSGYVCMLDEKKGQYYLFNDRDGLFVAAAGSREDWHKNFIPITKAELKNYDINDFVTTGRYMYNFKKMVMFGYSDKEWIFDKILLTNDQLIEIRSLIVETQPSIWIQSFDWKTGERKMNKSVATQFREDYRVLQKSNYLAIVERDYNDIHLWQIDGPEWEEKLSKREKVLKNWGMSEHEFYYETEHPENHDRIIHVYDFESGNSYQPIVRYDEEYKVWNYTIDGRFCYQVTRNNYKYTKELHAVDIW